MADMKSFLLFSWILAHFKCQYFIEDHMALTVAERSFVISLSNPSSIVTVRMARSPVGCEELSSENRMIHTPMVSISHIPVINDTEKGWIKRRPLSPTPFPSPF